LPPCGQLVRWAPTLTFCCAGECTGCVRNRRAVCGVRPLVDAWREFAHALHAIP
jgi:hypothetical protein